MGAYRRVQGKVDNDVAKAVRELYDFVYSLKSQVDALEKAQKSATPTATPAQPTLVEQGLNLRLASGPITISSGQGSPENVIIGSPGDLYVNLAGGAGTTLFVKQTGNN